MQHWIDLLQRELNRAKLTEQDEICFHSLLGVIRSECLAAHKATLKLAAELFELTPDVEFYDVQTGQVSKRADQLEVIKARLAEIPSSVWDRPVLAP